MFRSLLRSWICSLVFKQYIQRTSFHFNTTLRGKYLYIPSVQTILVICLDNYPSFEIRYRFNKVEANPALWLSAVSQSRVRDTFCSYGVMELCTKGLGSSVHALKARGVSLACVRTCVVVAEERPRIALTTSFSKLFSALGLSPRAVSTSFGCRVNTAICLQVSSFVILEFYN